MIEISATIPFQCSAAAQDDEKRKGKKQTLERNFLHKTKSRLLKQFDAMIAYKVLVRFARQNSLTFARADSANLTDKTDAFSDSIGRYNCTLEPI